MAGRIDESAEEAASLDRIEEALNLYEAEGEDALERIQEMLSEEEFDVFMDEIEDEEDDEEFELSDGELLNEMAYAEPQIDLEDVYCIPVASFKLLMRDFAKGENLGRLKKTDDIKFEIDLKSDDPQYTFHEESDIAHDVWEQYDVLVKLFHRTQTRLLDFCRLYGEQDFIPYKFVLKKTSLNRDVSDALIEINTEDYAENRRAAVNLPYKKNIEKEIDKLLFNHCLNTVIHM